MTTFWEAMLLTLKLKRMTTFWETMLLTLKLKRQDFVKEIYFKTAKFCVYLVLNLDPEPKLFQSRNRNWKRNKSLRFHNMAGSMKF